MRVKVTEEDVANGEKKLPEIPLELDPVPGVGDRPMLAFERADGAPGALRPAPERYLVVHFWASWCGPCKQQLPAVKQVQNKYADRGLTVLGLSLDEDQEAWHEALQRLDLPWPQGRLASGAEAGVSSVPVYWLLDPTGKMVGKAYDTEDLDKLVAEHVK